MDPRVELWLEGTQKWGAEFRLLRQIVLSCGLDETMKWGQPCYTLNNQNVVLIHGFKEYCALLFFKGALVNDDHQLLVRQTENVQSSRQIRFTALEQMIPLEPVLKTYLQRAADVERAGLKFEFKETREFSVPEEFQLRLDELPALKAAFEALTPGRQRAYLLHFSQAKQSSTRQARIEKYLQKILEGLGLDD